MEELVCVDGAVIGTWVTTSPEYATFHPIGSAVSTRVLTRPGSRLFIARHFDQWMRDRTTKAHRDYMQRHSDGGKAYA